MRIPTPYSAILGFLLLVISGCAGAARVALPPDALPGPELRRSGGELHVRWKPDPNTPRIVTTEGAFLESTSTHIYLLRESPVVGEVGTYISTEIPIENILTVELIMPSPSRHTPILLLTCTSAFALGIAASGKPYEIIYEGQSPFTALEVAGIPLLAGVMVGTLIWPISTWIVKTGDRAKINEIVRASRALQEAGPTTSPPPGEL